MADPDNIDPIFNLTEAAVLAEAKRLRDAYFAKSETERLEISERQLFDYAHAFIHKVQVIQDMKATLKAITEGGARELAAACLERHADE